VRACVRACERGVLASRVIARYTGSRSKSEQVARGVHTQGSCAVRPSADGQQRRWRGTSSGGRDNADDVTITDNNTINYDSDDNDNDERDVDKRSSSSSSSALWLDNGWR
jgi:hypothetical protein